MRNPLTTARGVTALTSRGSDNYHRGFCAIGAQRQAAKLVEPGLKLAKVRQTSVEVDSVPKLAKIKPTSGRVSRRLGRIPTKVGHRRDPPDLGSRVQSSSRARCVHEAVRILREGRGSCGTHALVLRPPLLGTGGCRGLIHNCVAAMAVAPQPCWTPGWCPNCGPAGGPAGVPAESCQRKLVSPLLKTECMHARSPLLGVWVCAPDGTWLCIDHPSIHPHRHPTVPPSLCPTLLISPQGWSCRDSLRPAKLGAMRSPTLAWSRA